ncbi:MAG TPA: aspartyl/asparaginyl beta-hydroxylase domain-containing protein [Stellaceae bacterium]|nr:aspartyl/asparaginyl beta-hydroxylase domain-containing protein [Stellaceae bacterium]
MRECDIIPAGGRDSAIARRPALNATVEPAETAPTQVFGTEGIAALDRPSFVTRLFMKAVAWAERRNLCDATYGNPPVYSNSTFPWVAKIEREWPVIRKELEAVLVRQSDLPSFQHISPDVQTITQDSGWKTFILAGYGLAADANIRRCPETWRIVQQIPGLKTAMFSIFEPGKHLPPHRGPYNGVLRFHLGLIVPEPRDKVAIRVADTVCHWEEGRALVFDDAYEHEAWNRTESTRVVLFVDFVKPLRFPARLVNWLVLNIAVFTPFIKEGVNNHREWERRFYQA